MRSAVLCLSALILSSAPAFAQGQNAPDTDALIDRGVDLRVEQRDAEALQLFEQAWKLSSSARARAQMGLAEQALGRWIAAETHLQEALAQSGDPWIARNRKVLEDGLLAVQQHLSWLQVEANVDGAEVRVNGTVAGSTPMLKPVRIPRASILIEVSAAGHDAVQLRRDASSGELVRESVTLARRSSGSVLPAVSAAPSAPRSQAPAPAPTPSSGAMRTWGWVSGGIGAAGLVATGVLAGLALDKTSGLPGPCKDSPATGCTPVEGDRINSARSLAAVANVTFAVGVIGLGAGALLLWSAPSDSGKASVRIGPKVAGGYGGLEAGGVF